MATIGSRVRLMDGLSLIRMNTEQKANLEREQKRFFGDRTPSRIRIMTLYARTVSLVEGGRDDLRSTPLGANSLVHRFDIIPPRRVTPFGNRLEQCIQRLFQASW
jgi:hypothetical protein